MKVMSILLGLSMSLPLAAAPVRITGTVLNRDGGGLAGARVELVPAYAKVAPPAPLAKTLTDAEGLFEVAAPESGCFRLVVKAEGHLAMEYPLVPLVADRELPAAHLIPSEPFGVRVEGASGRPQSGGEVRGLAPD